MIKHPKCDSRLQVYDIALIRVTPPFDMSDLSIPQLCLPNPTTEDYPSINSSVSRLAYCFHYECYFVDVKLVAIGWGRLTQESDVPDILQQVTLQRISHEDNSCYSRVSNRLLQFCAADDDDSKGKALQNMRD